jgi:hypothetical protein
MSRNSAQKRKFFNEQLNGIHDHLQALDEGVSDIADSRRVKARLIVKTLIDKLEELDLLLDRTGR